jgi:molybdate transport system ATP-binding protein
MAATLTVDCRKTFAGRFTMSARFAVPLDPPRVLILFGPSGSGKTTLLRCLAGLEQPEQGKIQFGEAIWSDRSSEQWIPPQVRQIGYMPQDYALFPTHTVAGNIEYGLSDLSADERKVRVGDLVNLLSLQGLERAKPSQLSGGQQQRVALARAIARRPRLLLLDEPLSALDVPTRSRLSGELRMVLTQLQIPTIVVTHDWAEALTLGDAVAVMQGGAILQTGSPQEVFSRPADTNVAEIVGIETVVQGQVTSNENGLVTVAVNGTTLKALGLDQGGSAVYVCIRAEDVLLEPAGSGVTSARNHLAGHVTELLPLGVLVKVTVNCGFPLKALITRGAKEELGIERDSAVVAAIKAGAVHLVPRS